MYANKPAGWLAVGDGAGLKEYTDTFVQYQLPASMRSVTKHGVITTNRFGMRDKDYAEQAPPGVFRIALLGASGDMGWGVGDGETYEAVLERRLNDAAAEIGVAGIEILNFAVPGYKPLQQRMALDKSLAYGPDAVFYVATGREYRRAAHYLQEVVRGKVDIPYPFLIELATRAGVDASTSEADALRMLTPYREELLRWLYTEIVEICRERNIRPVWVFTPQTYSGGWEKEVARNEADAVAAGFETINLSGVYAGQAVEDIRLAEWDFHPNQLGHQLLAGRLYSILSSDWDRYFGSAP